MEAASSTQSGKIYIRLSPLNMLWLTIALLRAAQSDLASICRCLGLSLESCRAVCHGPVLCRTTWRHLIRREPRSVICLLLKPLFLFVESRLRRVSMEAQHERSIACRIFSIHRVTVLDIFSKYMHVLVARLGE